MSYRAQSSRYGRGYEEEYNGQYNGYTPRKHGGDHAGRYPPPPSYSSTQMYYGGQNICYGEVYEREQERQYAGSYSPPPSYSLRQSAPVNYFGQNREYEGENDGQHIENAPEEYERQDERDYAKIHTLIVLESSLFLAILLTLGVLTVVFFSTKSPKRVP